MIKKGGELKAKCRYFGPEFVEHKKKNKEASHV